jgi:hypothetical protein
MVQKTGCQFCTYFSSSCECEYCYGGNCKYHECQIKPHYAHLKSFPFKKQMPCFQLDFWHSEFADMLTGDDDQEDEIFKLYREKYAPVEAR